MAVILTRLDAVSPELVELAVRMSPIDRRSVAFLVAKWACKQTGALEVLDESRIDLSSDASLEATDNVRQILGNLIEELDQRYFSITDDNDGLDEAGEALRWFSMARAITALRYAIDASESGFFCESVYEAHAATDDLNALREVILRQV